MWVEVQSEPFPVLVNLDKVRVISKNRDSEHKIWFNDNDEETIYISDEVFEKIRNHLLPKKRQSSPQQGTIESIEILDFLNEKTGRTFKPLETNLKLIDARLKEGATVEEMKQVIAKKVRDWTGDEKMEPYLRPKTLFGKEKYAQYSGELERADG